MATAAGFCQEFSKCPKCGCRWDVGRRNRQQPDKLDTACDEMQAVFLCRPLAMMPLSLPSIIAVVPAAINHLLERETQARARLMTHTGKIVCVDVGVMRVLLQIEADGLVATAAADATPQVTIRIKPADLPLILQHRDRAFSYVTIDGDADFANAISQLTQSLRWDAEEDLSRVIGDSAAVRIVASAKAVVATASTTQRKLAETTAEYFLEENPMLMRHQPIRDFAVDVARLRDDAERLSKRIDRLKARAQ